MASKKEPKKTKEQKPQTEVAVAEASLPVSQEALAEWGVEEDFMSSRDVIIPKLLLMQAMSDKVVDEKAKLGEIRDTANDALHGNFEKGIEVIPFYIFKAWTIQERPAGSTDSNDFKYKGTLPITRENDDWPFSEVIEGIEVSRTRTFFAYCLLPNELNGLPYVIPFRRTSLRAGRVLHTQMYLSNRQAKLPPAGFTVWCKPKKDKNDRGTFAVWEVSKGRRTTTEELEASLGWLKMVRAGQTKMDESDEDAPEGSSVSSSGPTNF